MGGLGSGRYWHYGANDITDNYRTLDVRRWQRDGFLNQNRSFGWQWSSNGEKIASIKARTETDQVILTYSHRIGDGDWIKESYPVRLDWTPCNYGGQRAWFRCPASGCGRRVAILYGGTIFACRHCHQLAYPSQRESIGDRATRRVDNIRKRLGWEPGMFNDDGLKPKGMHWRTFERLTAEHDYLEEVSIGKLAKWLRLL